MEYKSLNIKGATLDRPQLENYLQKVASDQILKNTSDKNTYPIPRLKENFEIIFQVYELLNEHIKLGIPIHPAGEWLLDNFYIIEETTKSILKELTLKKYKSFIGIDNGQEKGFARVYVLASQIVAYTDNKVNSKIIENLIQAYQTKKDLSMEEIWNIGMFMQIALIENITQICEKIYFSQMQKYRVENIIERLVENNRETLKYNNISEYKAKVKGSGEMKYPFIEYMSYRLKAYGRAGTAYINILEEQVNKMGSSIEEVIKKEHFDIALKKVSMANSILSIKELQRIDFLSIFEKLNGVEDILKRDPAGVYSLMDYKTKELYRGQIKELSKKTKISEIYIAKKVLELAQNAKQETQKQQHVGYYLIDIGREKLLKSMQVKSKDTVNNKKIKYYISTIWIITIIIAVIFSIDIYFQTKNVILSILTFVFLTIPIQQIVVQIVQEILGKIVKPKTIPKLEMLEVPEEYATFVVIPTIVKDKQKVAQMMRNLEVYYLANKSENIYFALLGDCSSGKNKEELFDEEIIKEGKKQVEYLNRKYRANFPKFSFIYRTRFWNGKEECYLGWERKRGLLNQFNEYLLNNEDNPFRVNTIEDYTKLTKSKIPKIKYIITLDADTQLPLNTGLQLIGAMAHILNKPILNQKNTAVIEGHALMQPRVGITLEAARKNFFTKLFAGSGGTDLYTNAISDVYQDNFEEGIFTGKGIYDLEVFSRVLKDAIPEDTVLSHDLLEGCYLRCRFSIRHNTYGWIPCKL